VRVGNLLGLFSPMRELGLQAREDADPVALGGRTEVGGLGYAAGRGALPSCAERTSRRSLTTDTYD
jgi:hypothetical protein